MGKPSVRDDLEDSDPAGFEEEPEELADDLVTREEDLVEAVS
jgi:hypothetical protein